MVLKPKLFEHFRNPSSFYYFLLFLLLKISLGGPYSNQKKPFRKGNFTDLAPKYGYFYNFGQKNRLHCLFLSISAQLSRPLDCASRGAERSDFFTANSQFIAPLPQRFAANTQFLCQRCLTHIFLILQYKTGEVILQRQSRRLVISRCRLHRLGR